jgi:F-type H+-transporting ATPase subunit a
LGCSFPVLIVITVLITALIVVGLLSGALGKAIIGETGLGELFAIEKPHIQLPSEAIVHVFSIGDTEFNITNTLLASWISIIVLVGLAYAVTHRIKLIPSRLQSLIEYAIEWMLNLCVDVAGEKNGRRFFPLVTTIFLFVLINAWMSLIPGYGSILVHTVAGHEVHLLRGANTDINLPLALALISFVFVEYYGIRSLGGLHYLGKFVRVGRFFGGIGHLFKGKLRAGFGGLFSGAIDIFVGILEALSEFVRIISFTFRLFGNMTGGEILILMMMFLVPWVLAMPFYGLELLVGFVQALIFGGLTLVFATIAVTPHEGEEA